MKALIAIMVVVILGLIGITAAVIHFSSFDTIDANIISGTVIDDKPIKTVEKITKIPTPVDNGEEGTSAAEKLKALQAQEKLDNGLDSDKVGYTIGYIIAQKDTSACDTLIKEKEDDVEDAKTDLKHAQEDLNDANDDLENIRDKDPVDRDAEEQALEDRKTAQDEVEDALAAIRNAQEDLMKKRLECASYQ